MNVSIRQAHHRGACYLYGKTRHFAREYPNQKAQIRTVLYAMTGKERQVWADEVRKLDESSAEKKQPTKKTLLKKDFVETQV